MFILAQIIGILIIIVNAIAMQLNKKKHILFMFILANALTVIMDVILSAYSGAIICAFSIVQVPINYIFERKNRKVPIWLIVIYSIISIILGIFTFNSALDILPIVCAILYSVSIVQDKEKNIRLLSFANITLWFIYDLLYQAYTASMSDMAMMISTAIGIYRFDWKGRKKNGSKDD